MSRKQDEALQARVARYKALRRETKKGDLLTFTPMAKVLGMSARNLKIIIDADETFPVVERGGEGHPWTFDARAVLDHMIARDDAVLAKRAKEVAALARMTGISIEAPGVDSGAAPQAFSAEALRQTASTLVTVQKLKKEQQALIDAEQVRQFLSDYHQRFQQEVLGALGRVDPAGQLEPAVRGLIENDMRNLLVDLEGRMTAFVVKTFADRP